MPYRNKSFLRDGNDFLTTTDEWERIKSAAMQRAREERSQVAADIVRWIVRGLRNAGHIANRFGRPSVSQLTASGPVQANR